MAWRSPRHGGNLAVPALAQGGPVRPIELLSRTQAANPQQYQAAELIAQIWGDLGLDVTVKALPNTQLSDAVWYNRDTWDTTMWQMVGRPERSDPDEFVYNLFHSSNAEAGYNFVGYQSAEYDEVAEAQRLEADQEARLELVTQGAGDHQRRSALCLPRLSDEGVRLRQHGLRPRYGGRPAGTRHQELLDLHADRADRAIRPT